MEWLIMNITNSSGKLNEDVKILLEQVIAQTFALEAEYKDIKSSYNSLISVVEKIVQILPNALWILNSHDNSLFLSNQEAKRVEGLFKNIDIDIEHQEVKHSDSYYYIKIQRQQDKITIIATDITEQKRKDRLLSMGKVAANLAHEIRNPIGSIELTASSLLKNVDIKHKPMVLDIKKSIWRVEKIIQATLLFTRGVDITVDNFSLKDLLDELDSSIKLLTHTKKIKFIFSIEDSMIRADLYLILIVIQNMFSNSIDSIEELEHNELGVIELRYSQNKDYHIFSILDNGEKIKDVDKLFEPYKTTKIKGNGLGLALSKQIVQKHGGTISFSCEPKQFQFTISKDF
jgi:signal transduction histidine kinase